MNVQVYVEKNPIGEPSITAASSLWQVYGCLTSIDQPELVNGGENWDSNLKLAGSAIVAHGSSRNSYQEPVRTSIPEHQVEENYSCKEWTHSPRSVERLGKRPKREWKGILGHSPRTLEDGRWSKQPQSELDRETQGSDWDHFEENYNTLNAYLPCGGGSQLEQEAGQVGWDRAHHYGGELFQPKSLVWIIRGMAEATMYQMYLYHLLLDLRLTGKQPRSDGIELTNMLVNLISVRGQSRAGDGNI